MITIELTGSEFVGISILVEKELEAALKFEEMVLLGLDAEAREAEKTAIPIIFNRDQRLKMVQLHIRHLRGILVKLENAQQDGILD